ncbi:hypothetical protein QE152_g18128 [Popillia japonica]|uniref:Retroviral polymerase SH3-like domain-containing protein n=1 Tax=Popillia japonica TaxID=7064 RepID=A0AAW1L4E8_POPJA
MTEKEKYHRTLGHVNFNYLKVMCNKQIVEYEIMFGDKPSIEHLKLYGSKVFVRVPEQNRNSKWDRKADLGILLGYENVGYRVLVNNKVIVARHVDIVEEGTNCIGLENPSQSVHDVTFNDSNIENDKDENNMVEEVNDQNVELGLRRSTREKVKPIRFNDDNFVYNSVVYVNYVNAENPISYNDALNSNDSENWEIAMDKEMNCLIKNQTWADYDWKEHDIPLLPAHSSTSPIPVRMIIEIEQTNKEINEPIPSCSFTNQEPLLCITGSSSGTGKNESTSNDWSHYVPKKLKEPISKKLRPSVTNPVTTAKAEYYNLKTKYLKLVIEEHLRKEETEKKEEQRRQEEHTKKCCY